MAYSSYWTYKNRSNYGQARQSSFLSSWYDGPRNEPNGYVNYYSYGSSYNWMHEKRSQFLNGKRKWKQFSKKAKKEKGENTIVTQRQLPTKEELGSESNVKTKKKETRKEKKNRFKKCQNRWNSSYLSSYTNYSHYNVNHLKCEQCDKYFDQTKLQIRESKRVCKNCFEKHRCDVCGKIKEIEDVTVRSDGQFSWICKSCENNITIEDDNDNNENENGNGNGNDNRYHYSYSNNFYQNESDSSSDEPFYQTRKSDLVKECGNQIENCNKNDDDCNCDKQVKENQLNDSNMNENENENEASDSDSDNDSNDNGCEYGSHAARDYNDYSYRNYNNDCHF